MRDQDSAHQCEVFRDAIVSVTSSEPFLGSQSSNLGSGNFSSAAVIFRSLMTWLNTESEPPKLADALSKPSVAGSPSIVAGPLYP